MTKRSARGRIVVVKDNSGTIKMIDGLNLEQQSWYDEAGYNLLKPTWREGVFQRKWGWNEVKTLARAA